MRDRDTLLQAITCAAWNMSAAAAQLGLAPSTLAYHLQRHGIRRPSRHAPPVETHAPTAALAAELDQLRVQARLLFRSYGHCPHRIQELTRIEARMRHLRGLLRAALAEAEPSDTRGRSPAGSGQPFGSPASWSGQV